MHRNHESQCQVIGAGAAGIGLIIALHNALAMAESKRKVRLEKLLDSLVVIEAESHPGGILGDYQINANTDAADAVSSIADNTPLVKLRKAYLKLPEVDKILISLPRLKMLLLEPLADEIKLLLGSQLKLRHKVTRIEKWGNLFSSYDEMGNVILRSHNAILCCGSNEEILGELIPWRKKVFFGGEFLRTKNWDPLPQNEGPIVITSASHSGFSCVWRLLNDVLFKQYIEGRDIVILQRRKSIKLRCDEAFATQHNIQWHEEDDVCPHSGLIFANGGLRKDAKSLYLSIRDGTEKRVRLLPIRHLNEQHLLLSQAGLIIQCAGFKANHPEIFVDGSARKVHHYSKQGEVTDCGSGNVIGGLFSFGLGMHILPEGKYHGEKSFDGSINGLQSYPLAIAPGVIELLLQNIAEKG